MIPLLTEIKDPKTAQEAIDKLTGLADEWALKLHTAEQELKDVEATAGETVLASLLQGSDGSSEAVTTLANARAQYDIAVKTLESIERHQSIAKANFKLARAHQKRQEASAKQLELDTHLKKVNTLLSQLQKLDGARYVPYKPPVVASGQYRDPEPFVVSLAETMQNAIRGLLYEAEQLESNANGMLAKVNAQQQKAAHYAHR